MLDIHVGVRRDELKQFKRIMRKFFPHNLWVKTDYGRWEDWREIWPEEVKDDDDIIHVVISTDIPMVTIQFLTSTMLVFLNEMTRESSGFEGRLILVSDHNEWDQFYVELCYPE